MCHSIGTLFIVHGIYNFEGSIITGPSFKRTHGDCKLAFISYKMKNVFFLLLEAGANVIKTHIFSQFSNTIHHIINVHPLGSAQCSNACKCGVAHWGQTSFEFALYFLSVIDAMKCFMCYVQGFNLADTKGLENSRSIIEKKLKPFFLNPILQTNQVRLPLYGQKL